MAGNAQILVRSDTATNWSTVNPILASKEIAYDKTNNKFKVGDGTTAWNTLTFVSSIPKITVAAVAPASPATNDLWVDTT